MNSSTTTLHANELAALPLCIFLLWRCIIKMLSNPCDKVSHRLFVLPTGGTGREYGGAALRLGGLVAPWRAAANRDGVNTAAIAVAGAVVAPLPSVP